MRRIRRVTAYACTTCFRLFPDARGAKTHAATHPVPPPPSRRSGPRRPKQTDRILEAVRSGAKTARAIEAKTRIPLTRIHSLLAYHRKRGNISGFTGSLKAT